MSWNCKNLADLPFLLVGPILRKVTPKSVNVFIVTKENCNVRLKLFEFVANSTNPSPVVATGSYKPMFKLGTNLYLSVVSLNLTSELSRDKTYGYNIDFQIGTEEYNLSTLWQKDSASANLMLKISLLDFEFHFDGGSSILPTFVLPPLDISKLRVLHGSCRKSHGESVDAMGSIFPILSDSVAPGSTLIRPQMLFLTGDQIYADDVSRSMLYMIDKYAQLLIGWDEDYTAFGCNMSKMGPGQRGDNIANVAKLSVEKDIAGSHLMKLREYAMMYCMSWSDAFWEKDTSSSNTPILPDFETLYPGESQTTKSAIGMGFSGGIGTVSTSDPSKTWIEFNNNKTDLTFFYQGLAGMGIRCALANIPTYMILDDHEVTDDLFYNDEWFNNVITDSTLGERICANGIAAYALFQGWGNKPEDFLTGTSGATFLDGVTTIVQNPTNALGWSSIYSAVLPTIDPTSTPAELKHGPYGLNWHYYYEVANVYEFIVLDTRTMRVFNNGIDGVPGLMSEKGLKLQIEDPVGTEIWSQKTKSQIFVISPTPVIGVNKIEEKKEIKGLLKKGLEKVNAISKLSLDLEHWSFDKKAYEHFYAKLFSRNPTAPFIQVILLGGDVHYGYSSAMKYWANQVYKEPFTSKRMSVAGLCSSSFKNEVSAARSSLTTQTVGGYSRYWSDQQLDQLSDKTVILGWQNLSESSFNVPIQYFQPESGGLGYSYVEKAEFNKVTPALYNRNKAAGDRHGEVKIPTITNNPNHDWHYRIEPVARISSQSVPPSITSYSLESYKQTNKLHKDIHNEAADKLGKYIVGENNIGEITFQTGTQGLSKVIHHLWWWNENDRTIFANSGIPVYLPFPNTIHEIDMSLPAVEPSLNQL